MFYRYTNENGVESLTLQGEGLNTVVAGSHPRFVELRDYLRHADDIDPDQVRTLLDVGADLSAKLLRLSERVSFDGHDLRFDGDVINNNLSRHIVRMVRDDDENYLPWVKFMENLAANPSRKSRMHLFTWLDDRDFSLTPDGHLLGYKGVHNDGENSSIHAGKALVNGVEHTGHIPNPIGAVVEMPRQKVNTDRDEGCSTGLHVGTFDYASGFGTHLLLVSVNPRDVVSVPRDSEYQKLRCCRYTVLTTYDRPVPIATPSYDPDEVFPDDDWDDGWDDDWDHEEEDEEFDTASMSA